MKSSILRSFVILLLVSSLSTYAKAQDKAENETGVWLTEGGEERSLESRPLPPMAMKMKQNGNNGDESTDEGEEIPVEGGSEVEEEEEVAKKKCKPDGQRTHPVTEHGTAMGKCYIPDSIWSKTCQAVLAVNEHYKSVESKVDQSEVEEAIRQQQVPARNPECNEPDEAEGVIMRECRSCTLQLKPNAFGVQLTCFDCQRGKSDKTCHYIIKAPKRRQLLIVLLTEEEGGERKEQILTSEGDKDEDTCTEEEQQAAEKPKKEAKVTKEAVSVEEEKEEDEECEPTEREEEEAAAKSEEVEEEGAADSEEKEEGEGDDYCKCPTMND